MFKMIYDETLESLDARIEQLRARRRDAVSRHEKRERSARNCACMTIGETVLAWYGDWHELDPGAFVRLLTELKPRREALTVDGPAPNTEDALRAYRALRRDIAEAEAEFAGQTPAPEGA
ncbi:MAG TPA: hypothetical protein IAA19_01530 [Candidatus Olsenella pullistercoris]|uniref:Uncharacterized protein n=1 Tax=Candidatus Olsenella pullistercoris TaxID=2838712 RepID=A0A9D2EY60_9ACTN|nr:hypothetical protein [Candidatus Olsenella pullistercoris]